MPERAEVELVDESGAPAGVAAKAAAHEAPGHLHRAFSVFLFSPGPVPRLLVQRRALSKYHFAGIWANTCCSHPAPGEDIVDSARRRLIEELGIGTDGRADRGRPGSGLVLQGAIVPAGHFVYRAVDPKSGLVEHEYDHVFVGTVTRHDGSSPGPEDLPAADPDEVEETRWITIGEARSAAAGEGEDRFAPWFGEALELALNLGGVHQLGSL
jgi:isopentenyl-diphosphate delta-isomerase